MSGDWEIPRASNGHTVVMMNQDKANSTHEDARGAAIAWWVRQKAGPLSREDRAAFDAWLADAAANRAAFDDISEMCELIAGLRTPDPARRSNSAIARPWLIGAGALSACFALFLFYDDMSIFLRSDHYAGVGETRRLTLADGSSVELNAKSAIAVHFGAEQRRLTLLEGEAWFEVASDPARPFVVEAAGGTVTALGTAFDIALERNEAHVTVMEHRVGVASGGQIVTVEEGRQSVYGEGLSPQRPSPANVARVAAWRRGKLIFDNAPLGDVVEALGRYHHGHVYFVNSALRSWRVTGVFGVADPVAAIGEIETSLGLHATYLTRYLIFLHE